MSLSYVTLSEQKAYSRIQHSALDMTIDLMIEACSAGVKNYLKEFSPYEGERTVDDDYVLDSNWEPEPADIDSAGEQAVKPEIKLAVMIWVDYRLKKRESSNSNGMPPPEVVELLYPLRDPALR